MHFTVLCALVFVFLANIFSPPVSAAEHEVEESVDCHHHHHHHQLCAINVKASAKFDPSALIGNRKWYAISYNGAHGRKSDALDANEEDAFSDVQTLIDYVLSPATNNKPQFCAYIKLQANSKNQSLDFDASFSTQKFNKTSHTQLHQTCSGSRGVYDFYKHRHQGQMSKKTLIRLTFVDTDNKNYIILNSCGAVATHRRHMHGVEETNDAENEVLNATLQHQHRHRHHGGGQHVRKYQAIAIFSTSKTMPKDKIQQLEKKIVRLGFNADRFRKVNNTSCP